MASLFEYEKEAIRIKAKRVDRGQEEQRKFSVDPNITSFEVYQHAVNNSHDYFHLLRCCKAFSAELLNSLPPTLVSATAHQDQEEMFGFPCSLTGISILPFLAVLITTSICRYVAKFFGKTCDGKYFR